MHYPTPRRNSNGAKGYNTPSSPDFTYIGMTAPSAHKSLKLAPKNVSFWLRTAANSAEADRLPMKVQIFPHDETDSIVSTVKHFYNFPGNKSSSTGVSFEDEEGMTLIARYENFRNRMNVRVRKVPNALVGNGAGQFSPERRRLIVNERTPPYVDPNTFKTEGVYHISGMGSHSHQGPAANQATLVHKIDSPNGHWGHGPFTGDNYNDDAGRSDGWRDAERAFHTRIPQQEQAAGSDISTDNTLQDKRRRRTKCDSSELPPLAPQHHAANSPSSPHHAYAVGDEHTPPLAESRRSSGAQYPLPSPLSLGYHDHSHGLQTPQQSRGRNTSSGYHPSGRNKMTPEPIASCISDEEVAVQLVRLWEAPNFRPSTPSTGSASHVDDVDHHHHDTSRDTPDASDTTDRDDEYDDYDDDDDDDEMHGNRRRHVQSPLTDGRYSNVSNVLPSCENSVIGSEVDDNNRAGPSNSGANHDDAGVSEDDRAPPRKRARDNSTIKGKGPYKPSTTSSHKHKKSRSTLGAHRVSNPSSTGRVDGYRNDQASASNSTTFVTPRTPANPMPTPSPSRKASSTLSTVETPADCKKAQASGAQAQAQQAPDPPRGDADLSTKPRCQRCRKSKKGCDRQRPCQRCRDAGIDKEGCISEDEGNGRRGRYGRHMGLPIREAEAAAASGANILTVAAEVQSASASASVSPMPAESSGDAQARARARAGQGDKGKKRKR